MKLIKDLGMLYPTDNSDRKYRYGIYLCGCGKETKCQSAKVKNKSTKSCGCLIGKSSIHGMRKHRLYKTWSGMIRRTSSEKDISYQNYKGRGIEVCERWKDVSNFINDMYPSYKEGLTLDRIDNDGNYEPSNCRWAKRSTQAQNSRAIRKSNQSGYRGVRKASNGRWLSSICYENKTKHLGVFDTAKDASDAYKKHIIDNNLTEYNV